MRRLGAKKAARECCGGGQKLELRWDEERAEPTTQGVKSSREGTKSRGEAGLAGRGPPAKKAPHERGLVCLEVMKIDIVPGLALKSDS